MRPDELLGHLEAIPVIDVHSHMNRSRFTATDLQGVLGYHMVRYPLQVSGADPQAVWGRGPDSAAAYFEQLIDHWPRIAHTTFARMLRGILADLYDLHEPLSRNNLPQLEQAFSRRANDPAWPRQILDRIRCVRILSSTRDVPDLAEGADDLGVRFTVEAPGFSGPREMNTWSQRLSNMGRRIGLERVATAADLEQVARRHYAAYDWSAKRVSVLWVSGLADFRPVEPSTIDAWLASAADGERMTAEQSGLLEAAVIRAMVAAFGQYADIFQVVYGIQMQTAEHRRGVARSSPAFAGTFAHLADEFPHMHFNILSGSQTDEPTWCSLCLGYPNVSLAGFWWSAFNPSHMVSAWRRRLDMVPLNCLCGFFSDGYCIDWLYARIQQTRRCLAHVLAELIDRRELTVDHALDVAREVLFESPRRIFLPEEAIDA